MWLPTLRQMHVMYYILGANRQCTNKSVNAMTQYDNRDTFHQLLHHDCAGIDHSFFIHSDIA